MSNRKYKIRKLIDGCKIDDKFKGLTLIAIPKQKIHPALEVCYEDDIVKAYMKLQNVGIVPLKEVTFNDKYGRKDDRGNLMTYTLCYYNWKPDKEICQKQLF